MSEIVTDGKAQTMILIVMAMAFLLDGLDGTIVTIALPEIGKTFNMSPSDASWIVTIYFMMMAGLILIFGKISDKGAIKKVLVSGFIIFALSSLACGLSQSLVMLLVARAMQGVGSAMLAATGVMLGVKFISKERRNFALSLGVLGSSLGAVFGPALGGVLTQYLSWHWIFFINVPVGIICAYFSMKAIPADDHYDSEKFDVIGGLLLFVALICGLYSLEAIPSSGFSTLTIAALAVFVVLFAVFIAYELRISNPVLELRLFKIIKFDGAVLVFIIVNACFMGILYLLPFMLNIEMGIDTVTSGMLMLIQAVVTLMLCLPMGKLSDKGMTRKLSVLGSLCLVLTSVLLIFTNAGTGIIFIVIDLMVFGAVWGIGGGSFGPRLIETVPDKHSGSASSLLSFIVYFGSALGTALFSAMFNIGSNAAGKAISELEPSVFMNGFIFAMIISLALSVVALVVSWVVKTE